MVGKQEMNKRSKADYMHLIPELRKWLGDTGLTFFRDIKAEHGKVNAVWMEGGIPHAVHFREGMQVRNKLRDLTDNRWSSHEYDDTWVDIIEECLNDSTS